MLIPDVPLRSLEQVLPQFHAQIVSDPHDRCRFLDNGRQHWPLVIVEGFVTGMSLADGCAALDIDVLHVLASIQKRLGLTRSASLPPPVAASEEEKPPEKSGESAT